MFHPNTMEKIVFEKECDNGKITKKRLISLNRGVK